MGKIKYYPPKTSNNVNGFYRLIIWDRKDVITLCHLFNGNLVLNLKIRQLVNLSLILNNRGEVFNVISKPNIITLDDAWLSGFTDAEGCFNTNLNKSNVIKFRFILDQNDKDVLEQVKYLFNSGSVTLKSKSSNLEFKRPIKDTYRYTLTKLNDILLVLNYFDNYPLKTNKLRSFIVWKIIYLMKVIKLNKTIGGFNIIKKIKSNTHFK